MDSLDTTLAYLAGLVDGEGYIGIKKTKPSKAQGRQTPGYTARIQVRMVDEEAIRFLSETLGGWYYREKTAQVTGRRQLYCYQASDRKAEGVLRSLFPYLRVKKSNARAVLILCRLKKRASKHRTKIIGERILPHWTGKKVTVPNRRLSDEYVGWCDKLWLRCKALNGR